MLLLPTVVAAGSFIPQVVLHMELILFTSKGPKNSNLHQCLICRKYHPLKYCKMFLAMSVKDRRRAVRAHGYCMNCMARSHDSAGCTSPDLCQRCGHAHNTLLHLPITDRIQARPSKKCETPRNVRSNVTRQNKSVRNQNGINRRNLAECKRQRSQQKTTSSLPPTTNLRRCVQIAMMALDRLQRTL
ncbi:uncharacterized protein LOC131994309 [Stomoxys calcitrans]|uniref:uncharacterized protein LOC131994309 n=1 Tax=Stomoxys calcitrans TaxID=35570 RepID=UPI0027E33965|nr:uncharacterized protein LOC131994309 [Stomoxys calcitrans]